jgi:hypothetical protein
MDVLRKFKAKMMLAENKRVTDAEAMAAVLEIASAHENELGRGQTVSFFDCIGLLKGGPRTNAAKEVDEVVYNGR